ncbi:hypothetical protein DMUE_5082 [Dictyocoela muelleri]|nr:hypothetical protein DMUE_5082 [Dictyocoela muelleri]
MKRETIFETVVLKMMTASKTNFLRNLRVLGVLRSKESCSSCKKDMDIKDITDHIDGQSWVCNNYHCGNYKNTISIRQGQIFANFRLSLPYVFLFIYCWSSSINIADVCKQYSISQPTLIKIYDLLRTVLQSI